MPQDVFVQLIGRLPLERWFQHGLLVAVSGGADSTALLCFLISSFREQTKFLSGSQEPKLAVGHVNHRLRGDDSDADARFVRNLAGQFGLDYFEYDISPEDWDKDESGSREGAARKIRYDFLSDTAKKLGFRYLATAHTADDQTETVLHRIGRGTGISGLVGIKPFRQLDPAITLVRPLLDVRRQQILDYLEDLNQDYRTDSSNSTNDFTRNRLRNTILPMLRNELNPRVDDSLRRLAGLAGDVEESLAGLIDFVLEKIVLDHSRNLISLNLVELRQFNRAAIRDIFVRIWRKKSWPMREMSFEHWNDLADFVFRDAGQKDCCAGIVAKKQGDRFTLRQYGEDKEALS